MGSVQELRRRSPRELMDEYIVTDEHGRTLSMDDLPSVRLLRGEPAEPLLLHSVSRATGEVRWRLLKAAPLRDSTGEVIAAVTVIENVTAVKMAELRARVLAESGRLLVSSLDYEQTLRNVAQLAVPALADWCIVDLVDRDLKREHVAVAHRDPAKAGLATRLRELEPDELDPGGLLSRVVRTGVPELYEEITEEEMKQGAGSQEELSVLRELAPRSAVVVPMRVPQRTIGVMTLVTSGSQRRLTVDDLDLVEQLGLRAAIAVENARLHTTLSDVAATLQQSLRPDDPPDIPGWDVAALYRPAGARDRIDVGGDFYEVFQSDAGWFALIGDVTGKGVNAAAITALVRNGARFASRLEPQPGVILARLDEFLRQRREESLCTALCVQLGDGQVVLSSAGHPPAMIVSPAAREVREAPVSGPLLGAFADTQWPEVTLALARAELMLLYTDGVTETTGRGERFGTDRLRAFLAEHATDSPRQLLDGLDRSLEEFGAGSPRDDVAALALRRRDA
jgi:serine phosphatase RsbU (regulator of sigma subunit)